MSTHAPRFGPQTAFSTMFSHRSVYQSHHHSRRRPWLLLWLVPYLLLSATSEGLHNHALELSGAFSSSSASVSAAAGNSAQTASSSAQVASAQAVSAQAVSAQAVSAQGSACAGCPASSSRGAAHVDCLACQWSAQAVGLLSLASPLPMPHMSLAVASRPVRSHRFSPRRFFRSRSPPSV